MSAVQNIKINIVGDSGCGKRRLFMKYSKGIFPEDYVPYVFEDVEHQTTVDGIPFNMKLVISAGQEDYERLRPLCYPETSCFMLCYSIEGDWSYENVDTKWLPELQKYSPNVPIVLVGLRKDIRESGILETNPKKKLISVDEGEEMKMKINAVAFLECSAKNGEGVEEAFAAAARASITHRAIKTKGKKPVNCVLM